MKTRSDGGLASHLPSRLSLSGAKANEQPVMVDWGRFDERVAGRQAVHGMLYSAETSREPQAAGDGGTAAETADSVGRVLACGGRQLRAVTT